LSLEDFNGFVVGGTESLSQDSVLHSLLVDLFSVLVASFGDLQVVSLIELLNDGSNVGDDAISLLNKVILGWHHVLPS
jgi:hypothetical protein